MNIIENKCSFNSRIYNYFQLVFKKYVQYYNDVFHHFLLLQCCRIVKSAIKINVNVISLFALYSPLTQYLISPPKNVDQTIDCSGLQC